MNITEPKPRDGQQIDVLLRDDPSSLGFPDYVLAVKVRRITYKGGKPVAREVLNWETREWVEQPAWAPLPPKCLLTIPDESCIR